MNKFHWFEGKQLDNVTNYSTEIEPLKYANDNNIDAYYYCSFAKRKEYFGLEGNIKYLSSFKNKYFKYLQFRLNVTLKAIFIIFEEENSVIMTSQHLITNMLPAFWINKILKKNNKFITDVRTTPTSTDKFESDMNKFHSQFKFAVKLFDGYSFITPYMQEYIMKDYNKSNYKSVNWSSGVNVSLFKPKKQLSKPCSVFTLFYHGGISISRGCLNLIKATENLIYEGYNISLIQVGVCVDKDIERYIKENNLSSWCELLPPVSLEKIPAMIENCDLPVLPFPHYMPWRVSSPIKLMEYLAMGKKVLAPNMEAFTDVFGHNSDLIYYFDSQTEDSIIAIKNAIKAIIVNKELDNGNYFPAAREFVENNYTWEKQSEKLFNFCKSL